MEHIPGSDSFIRQIVEVVEILQRKSSLLSFDEHRTGKAAPTEEFLAVLPLLPSFHPLLEQLTCMFESVVATSYPALPL